MVQATKFLHREYEPQYYWWEALFLAQRIAVIGVVQLIPFSQSYFRLLFSLLVTFLPRRETTVDTRQTT